MPFCLDIHTEIAVAITPTLQIRKWGAEATQSENARPGLTLASALDQRGGNSSGGLWPSSMGLALPF